MKEKEIIKGKVNLLSLRIIILVVVFIFALLGMIFDPMEKEEIIIIIIALIFGSLFYIFLLPKLIFGNCEVIVTNKRVYGRATFGKKVDLPFDKISAVATIELLNGVSVSTSSGAIKFLFIKNAEDVYKIISQLLIDRQKDNKKEKMPVSNNKSTTDELREYKKLLDENVITQEEFDKKKKELLDL